MQVKYWGHACFEIHHTELPGRGIIIDPFSENTGDFPLDVVSRFVLCTHDHFDHNAWKRVSRQDSRCLLDFVGEAEVSGVRIKGIRLYHDPYGGIIRGKIAAYILKIGDFVLSHLGDLGHLLDENQIRKLLSEGRINILFIPVGGIYTIGPKQAISVIHQLNPNIAIPMHFKHPKHNMRIFGELKSVEDFVGYARELFDVKFVGNSVSIEAEDIPEETNIHVMTI